MTLAAYNIWLTTGQLRWPPQPQLLAPARHCRPGHPADHRPAPLQPSRDELNTCQSPVIQPVTDRLHCSCCATVPA